MRLLPVELTNCSLLSNPLAFRASAYIRAKMLDWVKRQDGVSPSHQRSYSMQQYAVRFGDVCYPVWRRIHTSDNLSSWLVWRKQVLYYHTVFYRLAIFNFIVEFPFKLPETQEVLLRHRNEFYTGEGTFMAEMGCLQSAKGADSQIESEDEFAEKIVDAEALERIFFHCIVTNRCDRLERLLFGKDKLANEAQAISGLDSLEMYLACTRPCS